MIVPAAAISDQVTDRSNFQHVRSSEADKVVAPRHRAVVIHDLADHARRIEPGEARHIDGRLGMAGTNQHTSVARD